VQAAECTLAAVHEIVSAAADRTEIMCDSVGVEAVKMRVQRSPLFVASNGRAMELTWRQLGAGDNSPARMLVFRPKYLNVFSGLLGACDGCWYISAWTGFL
jgi:hypothetical protein